VSAERRPLDSPAGATMVVLTLCWGFQQVAIKLAAPAIPYVLQGALRSAVAAVLLLGWARLRGVPLWNRDGTLAAGLLAGCAFAGEFALIYAGLAYTSASRMIVFLYLAPCLTALGLSLLIPGERLARSQWAGILLAFAGVAYAFFDGQADAATLLGDACGVAAALLWTATTLLIRGTRLAGVSATKTLLYQLAVSAALLPLAALALGERGVVAWTPVAVASLAYQAIVVAFASYLAWFWLLTRYLAGRLAAFSFLTPLFGVAFGTLLLDEPLTARFAGAAALVLGGIALVNAPRGGAETAAAERQR
jgi:drug/metabolite transporter (DMT)-like permease